MTDVEGSYGTETKLPIKFKIPTNFSVMWNGKVIVFELISLGPELPQTKTGGQIRNNKYKIKSIGGESLQKEVEIDLIFASSSDDEIFFGDLMKVL